MASFRRLSSFFTGKRSIARTPSSPDQEYMYHSTTSLNIHLKNNPRNKFKREKSLTELMRHASKRGNGNSIIQQDDALVIMKGGKIVSVRRQTDLPKGSPFNLKKGYFKSREGTGQNNKVGIDNTVELSPLITNGRLSSVENKMDDTNSCGSDEVFDKLDTDKNVQETNLMLSEVDEADPDETQKLLSSPVIMVKKAESSESVEKYDNQQEDDGILSTMPLTPNTKQRLTRSDLFLDLDDKEDVKHKQIKCAKSSEGLTRPALLRFPSVEHLDIPRGIIPRSASDNNFRKHQSSHHPSPSAQRRWTFSKVKT